MAIDAGINIDCSNLQGSSGIRNILIRTWEAGDAITYVNSATQHEISS